MQSQGSQAQALTELTRTSPADVIMFSGCRDNQTSSDATVCGKFLRIYWSLDTLI